MNSNKVMKAVTQVCGGNGGGRPELAYGSLKDISRLNELDKVLENLK